MLLVSVPEISAIDSQDYILGAHRGASLDFEENTLEAFELAVENPLYEFIEFDIQLTSDGKKVVIHQNNILRIPKKFARVSTMNYSEVQETFDQVTGINDVSGVVFRLYNAAFARLPDSAGLKNWINANSSGKKSYKETAEAFADSQEFENRYGANVSNTEFVTTLYNNVLDRDPDANGLARYVGELNDGTNERKDLLYIFSESQENRGLFTDTTGLG